MNAILQCLIHTPLIKSYFTSDLYRSHISKKKKEETLAETIGEFLKEYEKAYHLAKILWKVKSAIEKFVPSFQGYDQHDAQEFLGMIIDRLNEELTTTSRIEGSNPSKDNKISIMGDLFCGELCNMITCPHCKKVNERREHFYYLSVPLPLKVI